MHKFIKVNEYSGINKLLSLIFKKISPSALAPKFHINIKIAMKVIVHIRVSYQNLFQSMKIFSFIHNYLYFHTCINL